MRWCGKKSERKTFRKKNTTVTVIQGEANLNLAIATFKF